MPSWTIRRAEPSDAEALSACITAAYAHYATRIPDLPPVAADCAQEIAEYQVWVADIDGEISAGLVLCPEDGFMRLANIAVHPDQAGKGLGRALMTRAETEAAAQDFAELRLNTHVDMPENVELYEHLGWRETGREGNRVAMVKAV
jgi:ribosomal protein S18 acetylase RimI-like enzyme